jgi:hypothetical protein
MKRRAKQIDRAGIETYKAAFRLAYDPVRRNEVDEYWAKRLMKLLDSDEPLDRSMRNINRFLLSRFCFSERLPPTREYWRREQDAVASVLKRDLQKRWGMTAGDAEQEVAKELGISVDALRQRLRRHRIKN